MQVLAGQFRQIGQPFAGFPAGLEGGFCACCVLRDGSAIASSDVMTVNGSAANKGFTTVRQLAEDEEGKGGLDPVKVTFTANNRYMEGESRRVIA